LVTSSTYDEGSLGEPDTYSRATDRVARDYTTYVFNEHHPERAREYVTSDVVWHGGSLGTVNGVET